VPEASGLRPGPQRARSVAAALARAAPVFLSPRIVAVVFVPLLVAAFAFVIVGWLAWAPLTTWLATSVFGAAPGSTWPAIAAGIVAFLLLTFGALLAALAAIATLAMPVIVRVVAARDYPGLERRHGGTAAGSVVNAALTFAVFVPAWLASLFLLALPPLFVAVSLLLSAWLNTRLFRYDALADHADAQEMRQICRAARGRMFALGLILAPLSYIPIVNLFAPLYAGVAFTYLCLDELAVARA